MPPECLKLHRLTSTFKIFRGKEGRGMPQTPPPPPPLQKFPLFFFFISNSRVWVKYPLRKGRWKPVSSGFWFPRKTASQRSGRPMRAPPHLSAVSPSCSRNSANVGQVERILFTRDLGGWIVGRFLSPSRYPFGDQCCGAVAAAYIVSYDGNLLDRTSVPIVNIVCLRMRQM